MERGARIREQGARLPDALTLGPVRLQVGDLGRSRAFYEEVLGLRTLDGDGGGATLGVPGTPLVELRARPGVERVGRGRPRLGLYHFAILLPGREQLGRFAGHLAGRGIAVGAADHLVSEALYLSDPDGLGIEVYADRPRDAWTQRANGEVAMATDPLDFDGLLAAAGDEPWRGMPAGTTLGHVHLHVGDLDRAEAFYSRALGFDITTANYPGALFMSAGGYHHHLGTNTWARGAPAAGERDARLLQWTVVLPDAGAVDAVAGRLDEGGFAARREDGDVVAHDPWGTAVRITAATS